MGLGNLEPTFETLVDSFVFLDKNKDGYVSKNEMIQAINETTAGERSSGRIGMKRFGELYPLWHHHKSGLASRNHILSLISEALHKMLWWSLLCSQTKLDCNCYRHLMLVHHTFSVLFEVQTKHCRVTSKNILLLVKTTTTVFITFLSSCSAMFLWSNR